MPILIEDDYPSIRAAIDITLDERKLPNSVIEDDLYLGAGLQDVLSRMPDAESETDTVKVMHIRNAAVNFVAARLVGALRQVTSFNTQVNGTSFSQMTYNPQKKRSELFGYGLDALELASGVTKTESQRTRTMPSVFRLAPGGRGR